MKKKLFDDNEEVYFNEKGLMVFTAKYLLERGYCCGSGCTNCPFDYKMVEDIKRREFLLNKRKNEKD